MKNIEDLYPLSPMQEGMRFHTLFAPESGVYITQVTFAVNGHLSVAAFNKAWQRVVSRHPVLRTAFVGEGLKKDVQVVHRHVELAWQELDWREMPAFTQQQQLVTWIDADRRRGFDLALAPLMRLTLIRMADDAHQFIWSLHHLLLDGWSVSLLLKEVLGFYEAYIRGDELQAARPRPYRDYIVWLRQQDMKAAEKFWRQTLKGFTAPTQLGVDRPSGDSGNEEKSYAEQEMKLSAETTLALRTLARRHQLTLNTVVQGAWALLLSRYSGEEDVVFGATVAGRPDTLPGAEAMIGLFINTLPLRVQVAPDEPLQAWLKQLQERQVEMRQYEYSALVQVQGWSEVGRGQPLFESIFVFENYPVDESLQEGGANLKMHNARAIERNNYPLTVAAAPGRELQFKIIYDQQRFHAGAINRMLGHLQVMLEGMSAEPEQRLSALPLLTQKERYQVLDEWDDMRAAYPADQCIHTLFEQQVERTPEHVAVVFGDQQLTYAELNGRANQLAHFLRGRGVKPDALVGVLMERSVEMVVGLLGVLKAGGAYVPLDPSYPSERLAFMLEDSEAGVLLTVERLIENLLESKAEVVCLDRDWKQIRREPAEPVESGVRAKNLAYVIYTSGSTGKPKGVEIEHSGLVNLATWHNRAYSVTPQDRATQLASPAFDASVWELWPHLIAGASIHIPDEGTRLSAPALLAWLRDKAITISFLPTPLAESVLAEPMLGGMALRTLLTGGDRLHRAPRHALPFKLVNHYGPTESSVVATCAEVLATKSDAPPPIGRPIQNTQVYLLDKHLQPVPVGVAGEIYIGGEGLARGYHNRPDLTAERFISHPFSDDPGARLYKTGDMARYLPDGQIEYLSRADHQVKIRGIRIELGEIEAALLAHPAVRESVAIVREDEPGEKRLVGYVVLDQNATLTAGGLRSFLRDKLPPYMVPSSFVTLEAIPTSPNGKADRAALPAPDGLRSESEDTYVAPRTPAEKSLADIWGKILRREQVGIHDNFFELGGDSILSIQIVARANQAGLKLSAKQLFQHQTIAELVAATSSASTAQVEKENVEGVLPLTPIQHWFFEQKLPEPHQFNQAVLLETRQPLDRDQLREALRHLIAHHDALRLRFTREEAGWRQAYADQVKTVPFTQVDLSAVPSDEQRSAIEDEADRLQASLNLSEGPLLRAALFDLGADKPGRLLIVVHHLTVDGVSWRILLEDLETAYRQLEHGEKVVLPPKTTSFKQWAERLAEHAQSGEVKQEVDYWVATRSSGGAELPVNYPHEDNNVASTCTVTATLGMEETRALLHDVPAAYRTQIGDVLLTALAEAFREWTGATSMLVDLEGHGREEVVAGVDLSRTVGWFTTIYPVSLEVGSSFDPGPSLKSIKEQLRRIPNHGIGYGLLRYLSGDEETQAKLRDGAQPQVSFNYLGQFDQSLPEASLFKEASESCGSYYSPRASRPYLLEISGSVIGRQLRMSWAYSRNVHRGETIERLAQNFNDVLRALIAHCQAPDAGGFTASDFMAAKMSQKDFKNLFSKINRSIERQAE